MNLFSVLPAGRRSASAVLAELAKMPVRVSPVIVELAKTPVRVPPVIAGVVTAPIKALRVVAAPAVTTLALTTAAVVVVSTAASVTDTATAAPVAAATSCTVSARLVPSCGALLGVSTQGAPGQTWPQTVASNEQAIGRPNDVLHNYHLWDTSFPSADETASAASGHKLIYTWIGKRQNGSTVSWSSIASGAEDAVIDAEAARVVAMKTPVFVNFQNEPESSVGTSGTAAEYVAAWRHIHDRFVADGASNAVWTVIYMGIADSPNKLALVKTLYPGDAYVDYIAWDPYNWGTCNNSPWKSFATMVSPFYNWLETNGYGTKPFMLAEYGTVEDPANPMAKADWFTGEDQALAAGQFPNLKVLSYFDHPAPPASCTWSLNTSAASLASYSTFAKDLGARTTSASAPGAPTNVAAVPGSLSATVSWTAPTSAGAGVTGYQVTASPGGNTVTVGASSVNTANVTGLTAGTPYTFTVAATSPAGIGTTSAPSASVTPTAAGANIPAPGASGWQYNGTAKMTGQTLQLTDATTKFSSGSAFWGKPITATSFTVSFDEVSSGGTGADGLALAFADAATGAKPTALGASGGGLGWAGTSGFAVALSTYANGSVSSNNFVGLATGVSHTSKYDLSWQATSTSVPSLRTLRHVSVAVSGTTLTVSVDGVMVLRSTVHLSAKTLIGFTSGDGNRTDKHTVSNVAISAR